MLKDIQKYHGLHFYVNYILHINKHFKQYMGTITVSAITVTEFLNPYEIPSPCPKKFLWIIFISLLKIRYWQIRHQLSKYYKFTQQSFAHLCHAFKEGWVLNVSWGWVPWVQFAFRCFQLCPVLASCLNLGIHFTEHCRDNILLFYIMYLTTQGPYLMEENRFPISWVAWNGI